MDLISSKSFRKFGKILVKGNNTDELTDKLDSIREFKKILMEGNNINELTNEFSYLRDFREFKKILMEDNNTDKLTNLVLLESFRNLENFWCNSPMDRHKNKKSSMNLGFFLKFLKILNNKQIHRWFASGFLTFHQ
jgi:hypothetical protein